MSILFKNVDWIVTQNPEREIFRNKSVYVEDNKIVEIGNPKVEADHVIDGKGKILSPGLINCHTHSSMTLFRGYADDMELKTWLEEKIWPLEIKLKPEDCYFGSLLACFEMIRFGVTCFNDMYIHVDEIAKAVKESGLRCFLGEVIFDWNLEEKLPYSDKFIKKYLGDELITPLVNMHSPYSCSEETLLKLKKKSDNYNILMHIHVSETEKEVKDFQKDKGKTPVKYLDEIGILNDKLIAVHCNWLTNKDVDIFSQRNCSIVHCPTSNMKLANGRMPLLKWIFKKDIRVGLGTDGAASNNNLDMFEEMKNCSIANKFFQRDPTFIPAQKALDLATIEAAKVFGIGDKIGSIEEDKNADLILVDSRKPHLQPIHGKSTVISNLVYSCQGLDVDSMAVNGKILMKNREVLGIDDEEVFGNTEKIMKNFISV
ncbi:MAG: amidohydrolase family protein [Candidatus Aenigmarchaeota archaeon]|nr:amidohydrolase family protein [Candidatus Aenigmarchaeota archaeon]